MYLIKKPNEVFSYICHFIFAIVIALSYETAIPVFMNSDVPFLSSFDSIMPGVELFVAYVVIISGWIGYSRSMVRWPHKDNKVGALRFSFDIAILFCYFGLIISNQHPDGFRTYFLQWILAIFVMFIIWDFLKIIEHYEKNERNRNVGLFRRFVITIFFTISFLLISGVFTYLIENPFEIANYDISYLIILVATAFLALAYRYMKWRIPSPPHPKNTRKKANH